MLKAALFDSLPKDEGVNSRKISVRWGRFRFFVNIKVCDGHQFCCFFIIYVIIQYRICSNHIDFISIGILIYENLGLDTKSPSYCNKNRSYDIFTKIKCEIGGHLGFWGCWGGGGGGGARGPPLSHGLYGKGSTHHSWKLWIKNWM